MILWASASFGFLWASHLLFEELPSFSGEKNDRDSLERVTGLLHEVEETLAAGLVPSADQWDELGALPQPWGSLAFESVQELRRAGGSLLPTLKRLRSLAEEHSKTLAEARAKSSQAVAQALVCGGMAPLFSGALYLLLPGIERHWGIWSVAGIAAFFLALIGAAWMLAMAESARWGGLQSGQRSWGLAAQCAGERFLALVRCGQTPDMAWFRAHELLQELSPELAWNWGKSAWAEPERECERKRRAGAAAALIGAGLALRRAVQVSLMEGKPCAERVENVLMSLRAEMKAEVEREVTLLGTRALKPLFLCVAPALLGLLALGLWLAWSDAIGN